MKQRHNTQKRPSDETKTRENRNQERSESGEENRNVPPSESNKRGPKTAGPLQNRSTEGKTGAAREGFLPYKKEET